MILSTVPNSGYQTLSGTSMAAPHVSGVAVLLAARFPGLQYRQAMIRLLGGAEPLPALAQLTRGGVRLNAAEALSTHPRVGFLRRLQPADRGIGTIVQVEVTDQDSVTSVSLHFAVNGSDYQISGMLHQTADVYRGVIPLQPPGTPVDYFVRGVDIDGNSSLSPTRRYVSDHP
jgi:subtilisin family serine protease